MATSAFRHWSLVFGIVGACRSAWGAFFKQVFVVEFDTVGGLVLDPVPERLELRAFEHRLVGTNRAALVGVFDLQAPGNLPQRLGDLRPLLREICGNDERVFLEGFSERVLDSALRVDITFCPQVHPYVLRCVESERRHLSVLAGDGNGSELVRLHDTEANPRILLDFLLQVLGELFVALHRDDRERIDVEAAQALAVLVDA